MSDQTIEQRIKKFVQGLQQEHYELLHKYGYADFKLEENPVDGYEAEALWLSGVYETELEQLLNEARIDENTISRDRFKEGWEKEWFESRIAQLTPKENK